MEEEEEEEEREGEEEEKEAATRGRPATIAFLLSISSPQNPPVN